MKNSKITYISLIIIHALIALIIFIMPVLSKLYAVLIPIIGFYVIYKSKNENNEALFVSAYLVGVEVFLRMTGGNLNNEYVKFLVIFFMLQGSIYSNFSKRGFIYLFFFILLLPGVFITTGTTDLSIDIKKVLFFNLSGAVCLVMSAVYMFKKRISLESLQKILIAAALPIITTTVYLFLYTPSVKDVVTGTQSNFETSGGFGPNQVSTILGFGVFIFFAQLILFSKSKVELFINASLLIFVSYRGIVTFSRGGIITAVVMILFLLGTLYYFSNSRGRSKFTLIFISTILLGIAVWSYSSLQTSGLINKRYANQDAIGREKKDRLGGREEIIDAEIKFFLDNPIFGVGAGMGKSLRKEELGQVAASHNEISRLFSEHGIFGVIGFVILFFTPLVHYINNRQHLYFLPFFIFWLLTINHAAMRIAAPAFVYALTLLSVRLKIPEKEQNILE